MQLIVLLTGNHLCHNPRVLKEATALARAGFDVEVLGGWFDASLKVRDLSLLKGLPFQYSPVIDLTGLSLKARFWNFGSRIRSRAGRLLYRASGAPNNSQFGPAFYALSGAARKRDANLFIAHSEVALLVARGLLHSGHRVGVDMEDWFSEDLPVQARENRPIALLRSLERELLRQGSHATCSSEAMSLVLAKEYSCRPPTVIYNAFPWSDHRCLDGFLRDRGRKRFPSIHWYSQTIGPTRGLEDLLAALPHLKHEVEVHLRGNPVSNFNEWLKAHVPEAWRPRVFVHGLVPNEELLSRIAEHDIGFAGEMKYCRNKDLTISNKILHYLLAGLAVVASDTSGQREVAGKAPDAVVLYPSGDAFSLAQRLNSLLESPERLRLAKSAALIAAEQTFSWERQEQALLTAVRQALDLAL